MDSTLLVLFSVVFVLLAGSILLTLLMWKHSLNRPIVAPSGTDGKNNTTPAPHAPENVERERDRERRIVELERELATVQAQSRRVSVHCFTETDRRLRYLRWQMHVRYKMQLLVDGLPIGPSFLFKEDHLSIADTAHIEKILDEIAIPLTEAGINVVKKQLGTPEEDSKKAVIAQKTALVEE